MIDDINFFFVIKSFCLFIPNMYNIVLKFKELRIQN